MHRGRYEISTQVTNERVIEYSYDLRDKRQRATVIGAGGATRHEGESHGRWVCGSRDGASCRRAPRWCRSALLPSRSACRDRQARAHAIEARSRGRRRELYRRLRRRCTHLEGGGTRGGDDRRFAAMPRSRRPWPAARSTSRCNRSTGSSTFSIPVSRSSDFMPGFYQADFAWLAQPAIKSWSDMKGSSIGISTFGSLTELLSSYALRQHGLQPTKDVQLIRSVQPRAHSRP